MGNKLALVALVLAGCAAEAPIETARVVGGAVGPLNVIDEVEIPTWGDDNTDIELVVITGVEIPNKNPEQVHIDVSNVDIADLDPMARQICAIAETLPQTDVCSMLCTGGFARIINDNTPNCEEARCELPGGVAVTVNACTDG